LRVVDLRWNIDSDTKDICLNCTNKQISDLNKTPIKMQLKKIKCFIPNWFIVFIIIYGANQFFMKPADNSFLNFYLNDMLAVPIVLNLVLISFKMLYSSTNIYLGIDKIIFTVIYISILFEITLPYFFKRFVGDWLDVLMYIIGGFIYFIFQKIELKQSISVFKDSLKECKK